MDLDAIQQRLEGLFGKREKPGPFKRLWGLRQEPADVRAAALTELFEQLRAPKRDLNATQALLDAARRELGKNVDVVEGLADAREHPPFAYVTWLWRVCEALRRVERELSDTNAIKASIAPRLPPLAEPLPPLLTGARLQGFAIAPLIDLASRETDVLSRRRRLLEAARRLLLESAAALPIPAAEIEPRLLAVSESIQEITAWQQSGVDADEGLTHQLRRAVHARDAGAVSALLSIVQKLERAAPRELPSLSRLARAGTRLARQLPKGGAPSLEEASVRAFGSTAAPAVLQAAERARLELNAAPSTAMELVQAANSVDASFELGRSVSPVRAIEEQRRMALVNFPTQTMVLEPARSVADLPSSLISDPRLLVHGLATRSLLSRRFLAERKHKRRVTTRCAEARYYLLDGSASMSGRRGRLRDAILISELSTMIRHLETGTAAARPVVYYRYFSRTAEPALKVSTIDEALAAIEAILVRRSRGDTDIEAALIDSFAQIDKERTLDPNLQRAQIVLISDGIAPINLGRVWRAREALRGMPVQVSVIAVGSESPELKELAATQRARGEPVFYHYVSLQAMTDALRRTPIARPPLGLPETGERPAPRPSDPNEPIPVPVAVELELWQELDQLVDELSLLHEPPAAEALEGAGVLEQAYEELGISLGEQGYEAELARVEALRRDARALTLRFERWFPDPDELRPGSTAPPPAELLEVIEIVVRTVSELTDYLAAPAVTRRVDAIELLERLLLEAGVSPWAYTHALRHATEPCREALRALRRSALH